jgi:hypothetical protein
VNLHVEPRVVGERPQLALDVVRHPLLDDEQPALAPHEADQLLGHERVDRVQHEERHRRPAARVGEAEHVEPAERRVPEAALHDDPEVVLVPADVLVESVLDDVPPRRGQPLLELLRLHLVREGRQVDPLQAEARGADRREHADRRAYVVLALERAAHVTGADPDREEDRLVARLGEAEPLLDEAGEGVEAVARVEQRHRRLQRGRVRPFLQDRRALAVVLADDDEASAEDTGGGDVRERVGGDVGADHRLPRDGAADRIVDGRAQERGGGRLAPRLLEVDAERLEDRLVRVRQHVDQVGDGRARIAPDVAHARLEKRLRDREDPLAAQNLATAERELLDVFREGELPHGAM